MYLHVYVCIYIYIYICTCVYIYIYICTCGFIYIYIHILSWVMFHGNLKIYQKVYPFLNDAWIPPISSGSTPPSDRSATNATLAISRAIRDLTRRIHLEREKKPQRWVEKTTNINQSCWKMKKNNNSCWKIVEKWRKMSQKDDEPWWKHVQQSVGKCCK